MTIYTKLFTPSAGAVDRLIVLLNGNPPLVIAWYAPRRIASPWRTVEKQDPETPATPRVA